MDGQVGAPHAPDSHGQRPGGGGAKRVTEPLSIAYRPIAELKAHPGNPRTHSKKQIRQIARSVEQFGFTNPILLDQEDRVLVGHGRLAAARLLGMAQVPTIRLAQLSEAQKRAYALADNRLAEAAGWDRELLALELRYISELELDFDLELTGFEMAEIDLLLDPAPGEQDTLDRLAEADGPPVTAPGDLWCLGRHRVLCADATSAAAFERVMAGKAAQLVFTDPPTTLRSTAMSAAWAGSRTPTLPWRRARCPRPSSSPSSPPCSATPPGTAPTARSITCSWIGGT
jgi:ParB-like nuclease domain